MHDICHIAKLSVYRSFGGTILGSCTAFACCGIALLVGSEANSVLTRSSSNRMGSHIMSRFYCVIFAKEHHVQ